MHLRQRMADEYKFINAYIVARKHTAQVISAKLKFRYGVTVDQEFIEELIELMAHTAAEALKLQNQLFTININKGGIDDDEPDETEH